MSHHYNYKHPYQVSSFKYCRVLAPLPPPPPLRTPSSESIPCLYSSLLPDASSLHSRLCIYACTSLTLPTYLPFRPWKLSATTIKTLLESQHKETIATTIQLSSNFPIRTEPRRLSFREPLCQLLKSRLLFRLISCTSTLFLSGRD